MHSVKYAGFSLEKVLSLAVVAERTGCLVETALRAGKKSIAFAGLSVSRIQHSSDSVGLFYTHERGANLAIRCSRQFFMSHICKKLWCVVGSYGKHIPWMCLPIKL